MSKYTIYVHFCLCTTVWQNSLIAKCAHTRNNLSLTSKKTKNKGLLTYDNDIDDDFTEAVDKMDSCKDIQQVVDHIAHIDRTENTVLVADYLLVDLVPLEPELGFAV